MKTRFFSAPDAGQRRTAVVRLLVSVVLISISIFGFTQTKDNSFYTLFYFAGFVLFFYSILYFWLKVIYYVISIVVNLSLFLLFCYFGINILVTMEKSGKLHTHGAEDYAWAIGSIFIAGIIGSIIGIIRSRMFKEESE